MTEPQKIGMALPVSAEALADADALRRALFHTPTPAEREAQAAALRRLQADVQVRHTRAWSRAMAGLTRELVQLHRPRTEFGVVVCTGCDGEPSVWPCRTFELVESYLVPGVAGGAS